MSPRQSTLNNKRTTHEALLKFEPTQSHVSHDASSAPALHDQLQFFGEHHQLADLKVFNQYLGAVRQIEWVVYAKRPFSGPESVLTYLSQYTHRVAISNRRLIAYDDKTVTFKWKNYRLKGSKGAKNMAKAGVGVSILTSGIRALLVMSPPLKLTSTLM